MNGMCVVALARGRVSEFHGAAKFVTLAARRDVQTNPGFEDLGDLIPELADFRDDLIFLAAGDIWFEAKHKHVNEHGGFSLVERSVILQ